MENDYSDGTDDPSTPSAALEVLRHVTADSSKLAGRIVTPWWYHLTLGLIAAACVGCLAFLGRSGPPLGMWVPVLGILLMNVLIRVYRKRYGVWVSQPAGPRSRRLFAAYMSVYCLGGVASLAIALLKLPLWWVLAPVALVFVTMVVLGRRYDDALRAEVGTEAEQAK